MILLIYLNILMRVISNCIKAVGKNPRLNWSIVNANWEAAYGSIFRTFAKARVTLIFVKEFPIERHRAIYYIHNSLQRQSKIQYFRIILYIYVHIYARARACVCLLCIFIYGHQISREQSEKSGRQKCLKPGRDKVLVYPPCRKRIHLCRNCVSSLPPSPPFTSFFFLFSVINPLPSPSIDLTERSPEFSRGSPAAELFSRENSGRSNVLQPTIFATQRETKSSRLAFPRERSGAVGGEKKKKKRIVIGGDAAICFDDSVEAP